jgi:regulator of sigma E protease
MGSEITMVLKTGRFSQEVVRLIPRWNPPSQEGATGIVVGMASSYTVKEAYPVWTAVCLGLRTSLDTLSLGKNEVIGWIVRRVAPAVTGPIGIVQATGEVAKIGFGPLMEFAALLSMNLAVVNILPIPMLDGGRVFFVVLEWIRRGKRISPQREGLVHLVGLVLLMGFVVLISYYDILRIIRGESFLR